MKCVRELHADAAYRCMLKMSLDTDHNPSYVYTSVLSELPEPYRYFLNKRPNCIAAIQRIRRKNCTTEPVNSSELLIEGDLMLIYILP